MSYDTKVVTAAVISFIFHAIIILGPIILLVRIFLFDSSGNTESIRISALENQKVYALHPRKLLEQPNWFQAETNAWGIFAWLVMYNSSKSAMDSIVMFNCSGKAVAEIVFPYRFRRFYVDDQSITIIDYEKNEHQYLFNDIVWLSTGLPFDVPQHRFPGEAQVLKCEKDMLRVKIGNESKSLHYFNHLPPRFRLILIIFNLLIALLYVCVTLLRWRPI